MLRSALPGLLASGLGVLASLPLVACRASGPPPAAPSAATQVAPEEEFILAFLVTGPERDSIPPERSQELQRGHMENIGRLARAGSLLLAGPFTEPRLVPRLRGIFVLDVRQPSEAQDLIATDPAVAAGQFAAEVHPWRSSSPLRALPALAEELQRERLAADANASPIEGRPYVLAMTRENELTPLLLGPLLAEDRVLFHGRFGGSFTGTSLWCLDETHPEAARARLEAIAARAGIELDLDADWELHPWLSTSALTRLPGVRPAAGRTGSVRITAERPTPFELGGWISTGVDVKQ